MAFSFLLLGINVFMGLNETTVLKEIVWLG